MPDLSAYRPAMRIGGWQQRHFSRYRGAQVAVFTCDATPTTFPATTISGTYTTGSESAVRHGFLVRAYSAGGALKGETRIRYSGTLSSTSLPIREHSRATLVIVSGDELRVYAEVRPDSKVPTADANFNPDGIPPGTFGSAPPPIANSGGHVVTWVDGYHTGSPQTFATVKRFGSLSFPLDPTNTGGVSHLWTLPTGVAFQSGSTGTDQDPILECDVNADGWLVEYVVTDADNGQSTTKFIEIIVHNQDQPPYGCFTRALDGDPAQDGWSWEVELFDAVDAVSLPVGSPAFLWADETIGGVRQSFGSPVEGASQIKGVGYARRSRYESSAGEETYTLEVISPIARLAETIGFSQVMIRDASPTTWQEVGGLTVPYAEMRLWAFYSNIGEAGYDLIINALVPAYDFPALYIQRDNPRAQIAELARATQSRMICSRHGRFELQPMVNLLDAAAKAGLDTLLELERDDLFAVRVNLEQFETVGETTVLAFSAHSSDPQGLRARAPGSAPGVGNVRQEITGLITQNITTLEAIAGRCHARFNKTHTHPTTFVKRFAPYVEVDLPLSYDGLDFYVGYITLPFETRLGDFDLSFHRYEIERISIQTDVDGRGVITLGLQAECDGQPGVDYPVNLSNTGDLFDPSLIWSPITFPTYSIDSLLTGVTANIGLPHAGGMLYTSNFTDAAPVWNNEDWGDGSALDLLNLGESVCDAVQKPGSARTFVVLTNTHVRVFEDVLNGTHETLSYALRAIGGEIRSKKAQIERGNPEICYIISNYTDGVWSEGFINGTPITPVRIGANFNMQFGFGGNAPPALLVDANNPLIAYVIATDATGAFWQWWKSTDGGVSWSATSDYSWSTNQRATQIVRSFEDSSAAYVGWHTEIDNETGPLVRATAAANVEVRSAGALGKRNLATYDSDPNALLLAGCNGGQFGLNNVGEIAKSLDKGANWTVIKAAPGVTFGENAAGPGCVIGGDGSVYVWQNGELWFHHNIYSLTDESQLVDKTGSGYPAAEFFPLGFAGLDL